MKVKSLESKFRVKIDGGASHCGVKQMENGDYELINPTPFDVADHLLTSAKESITVHFEVAPGIVRFVNIKVDGTVSIEDVPQAIGMYKDEIGFKCPPGRNKVVVPIPEKDPSLV